MKTQSLASFLLKFMEPRKPTKRQVDLRQKAPAGTDNGNRDYREFLDRGVRKAADGCHSIITERFFIKGHQIIHCGDPVASLGKPGGKDHIFLGLLHRLAIQNLHFNSVDWYVPPLQWLSVKTDS